MEGNVDSSPSKLEECRICHDEDEGFNMETPCSCRGSLKYAHRKCVQRWCNAKGDTICEICLQQYNPGYIAPPPPPPLFHYGGVPMNFRGNWEISATNLPSPRFIAMFTTDNDFQESDLDDYLVPSSRSLIRCRVVAIIFTVLLVLRYVLPIVISGIEDCSLTLFALLLLRTIAVLFPICIMVKAVTAAMGRRRRHRHHQDHRSSMAVLDEENDLPQSQQQIQPRSIRVQ